MQSLNHSDNMILRLYQSDLIASLRAGFKLQKRLVMCLPTGAGKTVCFSSMLKNTTKKTLILADRLEILTRTKETLDEFNIEAEMITPFHNYNIKAKICLAMVETFYIRHKKDLKNFEFIIIDESHKKSFDKLLKLVDPNTFVLGVTATPSPSPHYKQILEGVTILDLINQKYLSSPKYFGVDIDLKGVESSAGDYNSSSLAKRYETKKIYIGVVKNYNKICPNTKTLLFAPNIESSKTICQEFAKNKIDVRHLDSNMSFDERKQILNWFKNTNGVLCNVGICTTGFDMPSIETVILYRATKSLALYLQMVGRGARTTKNKKDFFVLDFGNNIKRHDFWEQPRQWTLEKKDREKGLAPVKLCDKCQAMNPTTAKFCWNCKNYFKIKDKKIEEIELIKIDRQTPKEPIFQKIKRTATTLEDVKIIVKEYGYKDGWLYQNKQFLKKYY